MRRQATAAASLGFVGGLVWLPLVPVILGAAAVHHALRPRVRRLAQERAIADALADVLELVHIAMASGTTIVGGLDLVADRGPVVVREAMGQLLDRHRTGEPLAVVLRSMTTTIGPAYQTLALVLIQSDREGSPLVALLQRLADEARAARRRQSEERLRRLPVQLLFPLVLCALPAVVIGAVVPLVISSMRRL